MKKRSVSTDFVTVLARLLTRHGNRVGALFYGDSVDTVIPARAGRRHVLHLLHRMLSRPERSQSAATNLRDFLRTAFQLIPRRSLVFVVSDFISAPGWSEPLAHLAQRHEILAVRLYDPLEMDLPDLGLLVVQDAETGEQVFVDTHDRAFRKALRGGGRAARDGTPRGVQRRRRGRARAVHGRRPRRHDPEVCRSPQAAQPAGGWRNGCPRTWSGARMTFLWPDMLWLLTGVPALVAVYVFLLRRKKKAALRYASLSLVKEAMGAGQRFRRHVPPLLFAAGARHDDRRGGPSGRDRHAADAAADHHSGHGRVGQHARQGRGAEPAGRGAGSGQGVRGRSAARRARRRGVLRGNGRGRAAAHAESRGHRRGHRPVPVATRHRHRQRDPGLAGHHLPRRRHRRERRDLRAQRAARDSPWTRRARRRRRSSRPSRPAPTPRPPSSS